MKKIRNILVKFKNTNPWLLLLWNEWQRYKGIKNLKKYRDVEAINTLYFNFSGKNPNIQNPQTFSEKQQWLKLYYHNPLMVKCADKIAVRAFIKEKGYGHILNKVLTTYTTIADFNVKLLPNKFVLKASHGSGWNLIVKNKTKVNWLVWKKIMNSWLKNNIFWSGREWPYKHMKPGIICEQYLEDESGLLMDYKVFCFNGNPAFVQANKGRDTKKHAQNFYDKNWKLLPFGKDLTPMPNVHIPKPQSLKEMISIATNLSQEFPFVRVDFYEVNGKVIFGELTFFPKSGLPDFIPLAYDKIIGEMLTLPNPIV